jgi:DNA damage-binding protein 1
MNLYFDRFRAPKNTRGRSDADQAAFGFLDGDFLELFLTRLGSPEQLERIIAGNSEFERLTVSAEDLQRVLENLQSMH